MKVRFASDEEVGNWDSLLTAGADGGNVFASYEIAMVKQLGGWKPRFLMVDDTAITVLQKSVTGIGKLWYLPKGPGVKDVDQLVAIADSLKSFAKKHGVFAVKIEPEIPRNEASDKTLRQNGLIKVSPIQPNFSTVILDLAPSLDDVMSGLNQKGRHAIRRAERDGVITQVAPFNRDNAKSMYNLLAETAAGQFRLRSFDYYYQFWKAFADKGNGQLFFAFYDGEVVAGAYAMYMGQKGTYKDGGSLRKRTAYGASHLLQWEVIKWMKDHGVTSYDLCGTPPSDRIADEKHPHYGLGRFKTSFNKQVTDYIGAYDIVVKPTAYKLWRKLGERAALKLHSVRFGENWY